MSSSSLPDSVRSVTEPRRRPFYIGPILRKAGPEGVFLDFNFGVRLKVPEGNYHARFTDLDTMCVLLDSDISGCVASSTSKYYINWLIELWKDGERILRCHFDCKDKNVRFRFPASGLGDVLAWFPYVEAFGKKHGCHLFCVMPEYLAALFQYSYPDIVFMSEGDVPDCYATYYPGLYGPKDTGGQPEDYRIAGLWQCIPPMLGLETKELRTRLKPSRTGIIKEPYVCIAAQASMQLKYWNNPRGWPVTVDHLKKLGYRVLCIDKEKSNRHGDFENAMPEGAEDFTGNLPLQERVDLLAGADFFVGLSSGLSWLAWAAGIPVVMISGFTLPHFEFHTPYRVINYHVCTGCENDTSARQNKGDFMNCPRHGGTDRAFECSRFITPEHVCNTIDRLMADHGLDPLRKERG